MARQVSDEEFSEFVQARGRGCTGRRTCCSATRAGRGPGADRAGQDVRRVAEGPRRAGRARVRPHHAGQHRRVVVPPAVVAQRAADRDAARPGSPRPDPSDRPAVLDALAHLPPRQRPWWCCGSTRTCPSPRPPTPSAARDGTVKSQTSKALDTLRRLLGDAVIPVSTDREPPMTDRLSALLHEEADRLDVPMPAARETILAAGRRHPPRRRLDAGGRRGRRGGRGRRRSRPRSAAPRRGDAGRRDHVADRPQAGAPADLGPVFAVGDTVYLDGGATAVQLDEVAQTHLLHLRRPAACAPTRPATPTAARRSTSRWSRPDGTVEQLDLTLGEVVPSTDPTSPTWPTPTPTAARSRSSSIDVTTDERGGPRRRARPD